MYTSASKHESEVSCGRTGRGIALTYKKKMSFNIRLGEQRKKKKDFILTNRYTKGSHAKSPFPAKIPLSP